MHDLECAHLMLAGAGAKLDAQGPQGCKAMDGYMRRLDGLLSHGEREG